MYPIPYPRVAVYLCYICTSLYHTTGGHPGVLTLITFWDLRKCVEHVDVDFNDKTNLYVEWLIMQMWCNVLVYNLQKMALMPFYKFGLRRCNTLQCWWSCMCPASDRAGRWPPHHTLWCSCKWRTLGKSCQSPLSYWEYSPHWKKHTDRIRATALTQQTTMHNWLSPASWMESRDRQQ